MTIAIVRKEHAKTQIDVDTLLLLETR